MPQAISIRQLISELEQMRTDMDAGKLRTGDYDQHLSRLIGELREQKLDADRPAVLKALADALQRGVITPSVKDHLEARLGLA
jgi:hypothetical protein